MPPRPMMRERRVSFNLPIAVANRRVSLAPMLILFLLVSCAGPQAAPDASASVPKLTPGTPAVTASPTETPAPNMPVGATGKDSEGRWIKTENGKTYYFLPEVFGSQEFESRMKNGPINLTGYGDSIFDPVTLNANLFTAKHFEYANDLKYLVHPPGPSDYVTRGFAYDSLASTLITDMFCNKNGYIVNKSPDYKAFRAKYNNFKTDQDRQQFFKDANMLIQDLNNGGTINVGGSSWEVRKGYEVYWINQADAKKDSSIYFANGLGSKVTVVDGKLIAVLAASGSENLLKDNVFRMMILAPLQAVIWGETNKIWWPQYDKYGAFAGTGNSVNGQPITTVTIDLVP